MFEEYICKKIIIKKKKAIRITLNIDGILYILKHIDKFKHFTNAEYLLLTKTQPFYILTSLKNGNLRKLTTWNIKMIINEVKALTIIKHQRHCVSFYFNQ